MALPPQFDKWKRGKDDFAKEVEKDKPAAKKEEKHGRGAMQDAHSGHGRKRHGRGEGSY